MNSYRTNAFFFRFSYKAVTCCCSQLLASHVCNVTLNNITCSLSAADITYYWSQVVLLGWVEGEGRNGENAPCLKNIAIIFELQAMPEQQSQVRPVFVGRTEALQQRYYYQHERTPTPHRLLLSLPWRRLLLFAEEYILAIIEAIIIINWEMPYWMNRFHISLNSQRQEDEQRGRAHHALPIHYINWLGKHITGWRTT